MSQIVHIFRKDCRRLWPTIAAVLVFTFLHGYGDTLNFGGAGVAFGLSPYVLLYILVGLSGLFLPILLFLLVVSVIHEESLVGSDEFWVTRPYSRRSLALEKLLFVVLWVFLPMLLHDLILIRYFGFPFSSAFGLLLWKNFQFGFFLLAAAALAVLSASFARTVLLAIGTVIITTLFIFFVDMPGGSATAAAMENLAYPVLAMLAVVAVGALCVIAFQYRFRITPVAAVIGVATILGGALVVDFWPESLTAYLSHRNDSTLLQSVQLLPDANLRDLPEPHPAQDAGDQARTAYYPFRAVGLSDYTVDLVGISAEFASPGQKPAHFRQSAQVRFQPPPGARVRFADAGGPDQLVPFTPNFPGDYERLKNTDGVMSGKMFLEGFRSTVARMPVPQPQRQQAFAIADRRCTVWSFLRERNLSVVFNCVELEPGKTPHFEARLLQGNRQIAPSQTQGQSSSTGDWPGFLSPILRTNFTREFDLQGSSESSTDEPSQAREILVLAEQSLGQQDRSFRIEHFRPADLTLQDWEQRGVLRAGSTSTQSNGGTSPRHR